jgi:hypothetical protein
VGNKNVSVVWTANRGLGPDRPIAVHCMTMVLISLAALAEPFKAKWKSADFTLKSGGIVSLAGPLAEPLAEPLAGPLNCLL